MKNLFRDNQRAHIVFKGQKVCFSFVFQYGKFNERRVVSSQRRAPTKPEYKVRLE